MPGPTGPGDNGNGNIPRPFLSCDSPECMNALAAGATDRNRVLSKCAQVEATKGRRDLLAIIAGALLTAGLAALAAAGAASASYFGTKVTTSCPPSCWGDLALSACPD